MVLRGRDLPGMEIQRIAPLDSRKACALSPLSQVPYYCYVPVLRRAKAGRSHADSGIHRRSSFGINCVQCDNDLIAPERSEYRDGRHIRHFWRCAKCHCCFEVVSPADTRPIKDIMTRIEDIMKRDDVFPSRLVA